MVKITEVIVVEGRYDKNTLSQVVDATILETSGFGIFKDKALQKLLRKLAETRGIVILTDSDAAGFMIRRRIGDFVPQQYIRNAYIPDIYGKERRKDHASREGKLGVEGMRPEVLLEALQKAGVCGETTERTGDKITKTDLYRMGLSGGANSSEKRSALLKRLDLPEHLTADGMLEILNILMSREEFLSLDI